MITNTTILRRNFLWRSSATTTLKIEPSILTIKPFSNTANSPSDSLTCGGSPHVNTGKACSWQSRRKIFHRQDPNWRPIKIGKKTHNPPLTTKSAELGSPPSLPSYSAFYTSSRRRILKPKSSFLTNEANLSLSLSHCAWRESAIISPL